MDLSRKRVLVTGGSGFLYVADCAEAFTGRMLWDTSKPNGQPRRMLETSRAKKYVGFEALTPFKDGLKQTVKWYQQEFAKHLRSPAVSSDKA